ncbi:unnamed protein product [Rhodiola kirilowii]
MQSKWSSTEPKEARPSLVIRVHTAEFRPVGPGLARPSFPAFVSSALAQDPPEPLRARPGSPASFRPSKQESARAKGSSPEPSPVQKALPYFTRSGMITLARASTVSPVHACKARPSSDGRNGARSGVFPKTGFLRVGYK